MDKIALPIKTDKQNLGGNNWRIFVIDSGQKFSIDIICNSEPSHDNILEVWGKARAQFFIEV